MRLRMGMLGTIDHINMFAPRASEREDIEFVGIAEPDETRGKELAAKFHTRHFRSVKELEGEKLDAVGIFTPFHERTADIVRCLDRGLHVMTDKPAVVTTAGLADLTRALEGHPDRVFTMGLVLRTLPVHIRMREMLAKGEIGTPVTVIARKSYTMRRSARPLFMFDEKLSGGEWVELAVHDIDLARWITGREYESVMATHGNVTSPSEPFQDHGAGLFRLEGGLTTFITHNRLNPTTPGEDMRGCFTVVGSEGVIDHAKGLRIWNGAGPAREVTELPPAVSFFDNFVDAIRSGARLVVPREDVLRISQVALATHQSARQGGPVSLR